MLVLLVVAVPTETAMVKACTPSTSLHLLVACLRSIPLPLSVPLALPALVCFLSSLVYSLSSLSPRHSSHPRFLSSYVWAEVRSEIRVEVGREFHVESGLKFGLKFGLLCGLKLMLAMFL